MDSTSTLPKSQSALPETALRLGWFLMPVVSGLAGVWAYGGRAEQPQYLIAVVALILGGWLPFWRAMTHTRWAEAFLEWSTWDSRATIPMLPYTQPGTPGDRLHTRLEQAKSWWQEQGRTALYRPVQNAVLTAVASVLISVYLGRDAILLTLVFITLTELAVLWHGGNARVGLVWSALCMASLPWLLGSMTGSVGGYTPYLAALSLAVLIAVFAWASPLAITGPLTAAAFLTWQGAPAAAMWVLLLGLPAYLLLAQKPDQNAHYRNVGAWLLLMIVVYAVVL